MKKAIWICAAIAAVLAIVFVVVCFSGTEDANPVPEATLPAIISDLNRETETATDQKIVSDLNREEKAATDQIIIPDSDLETFEISYADLILKYPKRWQDHVIAQEQKDGSLLFSVDGATIFTLYADELHDILGTVIGDKNTVLSATLEKINPAETDKVAMQEDINIILLHLSEDYDFVPGTAIPSENYDMIPIKTSVAELYYPAKWKDQVKIEVNDDKVSFTADGTPLFDVVFRECEGNLLGTYGDTPIYIVEYEVTEESHSLMQMGISDILEHLMEDEKFVVNR